MKEILLFTALVFCFNSCSLNKIPVSASDNEEVSISERGPENSNSLRYVLIRFDSKEVLEYKGLIRDFNRDIGLSHLRITTILLGNNRDPYFLIRRFSDINKANDYVAIIEEKSMEIRNAEIFVFSQEEYREFVKQNPAPST